MSKLKKWTLARCQNAKYVYGLFEEDYRHVERMRDDYLGLGGGGGLVLITERHFEELKRSSGEQRSLRADVLERRIGMVKRLMEVWDSEDVILDENVNKGD